MIYREYGKTGKNLSIISMGTNRFPDSDLDSEAGLARCTALAVEAAREGVNYFDIGHNYAKSKCELIFRDAFAQMRAEGLPFYSSAKSMSAIDKTADDVLRRVESSLEAMQLAQIDFFYMWSILSAEQYAFIMRKGGPYDGAQKARERGLISHIAFSNHAPTPVTLQMIEGGAFEGITLSFNLLNYTSMQDVLPAAAAKGMGVAVMNPLAGGIIPQNPAFFSRLFACAPGEVADIANNFVLSHPQITTILSGVSNTAQLKENLSGVLQASYAPGELALRVSDNMVQAKNLCTGCRYCENCPQGIAVSEYMQAYNMLFLTESTQMYGRTDKDLLKRIAALRRLKLDYNRLLDEKNEVCVHCSRCENVCTQQLPITKRLAEMREISILSGATMQRHKHRLGTLLNHHGYKKVGFYTGGGYTAYIIDEYKHYFGEPPFEIVIFESDLSKCGTKLGGYDIHAPKDIPDLMPDCILISNYKFEDEIYRNLQQYAAQNIEILRLHEPDDVPWVF